MQSVYCIAESQHKFVKNLMEFLDDFNRNIRYHQKSSMEKFNSYSNIRRIAIRFQVSGRFAGTTDYQKDTARRFAPSNKKLFDSLLLNTNSRSSTLCQLLLDYLPQCVRRERIGDRPIGLSSDLAHRLHVPCNIRNDNKHVKQLCKIRLI